MKIGLYDASMYREGFSKVFLAALIFTWSCGPSLEGDLPAESDEEQLSTPASTVAAEEEIIDPDDLNDHVEIPVSIYLDQTQQGLGLVDVTAAVSYSVSLAGCATGYSETSSTTLAPYKFDQGCYAKLDSFVYDGTDNFTYNQTATGAVAFTDSLAGYASGNSAVFATADAAPTEKTLLRVYVEQQLSNPIAAGDSVVFRFSHVEKGSDTTTLKSTIDQNGTTVTTTSVAPPSFTLDSATLVNVTAAGAGEWEFVFQCSAAISGSGNDRVCEEVDMFDNLRMMLVADTWGSSPTVTDLETAFTASSPVATGDIHDAGTTTTNGGFKSPDTGEANVLTGPNAMHNNPNMILILRSEDPSTAGEYSWQYFNFDVDTGG